MGGLRGHPTLTQAYLEESVEGDDHSSVSLVPVQPTTVQEAHRQGNHTAVYTCTIACTHPHTHTPTHLGSLAVLVSLGSSTVMEMAGGLSTSAHERHM